MFYLTKGQAATGHLPGQEAGRAIGSKRVGEIFHMNAEWRTAGTAQLLVDKE